MIIKISNILLLLVVFFVLITYASDFKVFSVESLGELKLIMKRVEEIRSKPKDEVEVPEGFDFIKGKYYIDTYTLETKTNKVLWSKTISYSAVLEKSLGSNINIFAIKCIDKSLYVVYSNRKNVFLDELQNINTDNWELKRTVDFKIDNSSLNINKCSLVANEKDKLEIVFKISDEKIYTYNYKEGEIKKQD